MNNDIVSKYIVNIDEIDILMDRLKSTIFTSDENEFEYKIYSNKYTVTQINKNFIFFLEDLMGQIIDITLIFNQSTNRKFNLKIGEKLIVENKPTIAGKIKYVFPAPIDYYYESIFIDFIDGEEKEDFYINVGIKIPKVKIEKEKNCFIYFYNLDNNELLKEISFYLPKNNIYNFNPPLEFNDFILEYSEDPYIQEKDIYDFNIVKPEYDNILKFNFFYRKKEVIL